MDLGLTGKRILVTGGASGLGAALTRDVNHTRAIDREHCPSRVTDYA